MPGAPRIGCACSGRRGGSAREAGVGAGEPLVPGLAPAPLLGQGAGPGPCCCCGVVGVPEPPREAAPSFPPSSLEGARPGAGCISAGWGGPAALQLQGCPCPADGVGGGPWVLPCSPGPRAGVFVLFKFPSFLFSFVLLTENTSDSSSTTPHFPPPVCVCSPPLSLGSPFYFLLLALGNLFR